MVHSWQFVYYETLNYHQFAMNYLKIQFNILIYNILNCKNKNSNGHYRNCHYYFCFSLLKRYV